MLTDADPAAEAGVLAAYRRARGRFDATLADGDLFLLRSAEQDLIDLIEGLGHPVVDLAHWARYEVDNHGEVQELPLS
jgi:hypothetical protein